MQYLCNFNSSCRQSLIENRCSIYFQLKAKYTLSLKLLSCKTISQALNIKRSKVRYYCNNSNYIRPINYGEGGCYRRNVEIYKYI